jgi:hypothetical protein
MVHRNHFLVSDSFFLYYFAGVVRLSALRTATTNWPIEPAPDDEYGAFGAVRNRRGKRSTRRKPTPMPFSLPQIPHNVTWDRTLATAVGSRRLTV